MKIELVNVEADDVAEATAYAFHFRKNAGKWVVPMSTGGDLTVITKEHERVTALMSLPQYWGAMKIESDMETQQYALVVEPWIVTWYGADGVLRRGYVSRTPAQWAYVAASSGGPETIQATYSIPFWPPVTYPGGSVSTASLTVGTYYTGGGGTASDTQWGLPYQATDSFYTAIGAPLYSSVAVPANVAPGDTFSFGFDVYLVPEKKYRTHGASVLNVGAEPYVCYSGAITMGYVGDYYNGPIVLTESHVTDAVDTARFNDPYFNYPFDSALGAGGVLHMAERTIRYEYTPFLTPIVVSETLSDVQLPLPSATYIGQNPSANAADARAERLAGAAEILAGLLAGTILPEADMKLSAPTATGAALHAWGKSQKMVPQLLSSDAEHRVVKLSYTYTDASGNEATDTETYYGSITVRGQSTTTDATGRTHTVARLEVEDWSMFGTAATGPAFEQTLPDVYFPGMGSATQPDYLFMHTDGQYYDEHQEDICVLLSGYIYVDTTQVDPRREVLSDFRGVTAPVFKRWRERFPTQLIAYPAPPPDEEE